ncbi:MAG: YfbR-like 5'-deoxynucleotidase [Patescibacteria group bacterium]
MYAPIDITAFPPDRETGLRNIKRYRMFEVMYYRPTVWEHTQRVMWIVEALSPHIRDFLDVNVEKARVMALVHDDAEMITGDIPAGHKARMTPEELKKLDDDEFTAIDTLSARYPHSVHGYTYKDLVREMVHYTSNEAKFVSLADKIDAHCESYHEVFAGNLTLISSMAFYINTLQRFGEKFPELASFVRSNAHPLIQEIGPLPANGKVGPKDFEAFNKPHTRASLSVPSRFPFYDAWRSMVVERGGEEGVRWLTEQRESVQ